LRLLSRKNRRKILANTAFLAILLFDIKTLMSLGKIFLNYRRDDSEGYVGRLYDHLTDRFPGRVFRDVTGLRPGEDFVSALDREGVSCQVLLAVIGRRWVSSTDSKGRRRLEDPADILRSEIVHALQRNVLVVPVLVGGATMPDAEDLPADLRPLARRQALPISELDFERDLQRLVDVIAQELKCQPNAGQRNVVPPPPSPPAVHKPRRWLWVLGGVFVGIVLIAIIEGGNSQKQNQTGDPNSGGRSSPQQVVAPAPADSTSPQPASSPPSRQSQAPTQSPNTTTPSPDSGASLAPNPAATKWQQDVMSTLVAMNSARGQVAAVLSGTPRSIQELQYQAQQLQTAVNGYDQQIDTFSDLLAEGQSDGYLLTPTDRAQAAALQQVCQIRKQQAARYRYQAQLVLQYNPYTTADATLMSQVMAVQNQINALDLQAAGLLQQAGIH
jgi:hypothetical protein